MTCDMYCKKMNIEGTVKIERGTNSCKPEMNWYINSFYTRQESPANIIIFCCFYGNLEDGLCLRNVGTYTGCGYANQIPPVGNLIGFYPIPSQKYPNTSVCFYEYTCN